MTAGKRPRLMMRRTVSVASLGAEACGSDHPSDHPQQQQQQQPPAVHQVIGFAPKAYSESSKFMLDTSAPMVFGEPPSPSPSPRSGKPFSGLSLISDTPGKEPSSSSGGEAHKVGLGIVASFDIKEEMVGSSPVFRSSPAPPPASAVGVNSPRYLPPPDFINPSAKHKSPAVEQHHLTSATFCFQANSGKHDRCSLRPSFTTLGFLKSCYLCKRDISHGHDIYMYRGDRAFCSAECRHQQILNDERSERKCSSAALKQMGGVNQQQPRVHQRSKVSTAPATTAAAA